MVSVFENTFSGNSFVTSPEGAIGFIVSDTFKEVIDYLRKLNKKEYDAEKKNLQCVTWSGTFKEGTRTKETMLKYSKLVCLDIDKLEESAIVLLKSQLAKDPFVRYCFVSPSGKGLKIIVEVNTGVEHHRAAFLHLQKTFEEKYLFKVDPSGKDETRLCYLSYDNQAIINQSSTVFEVDVRYGDVVSEYKNTYTGPGTSDVDRIFKVCVIWVERNKAYVEGQRNVYIHALACALNRTGVSQDDAISLISQNYETPDQKWHQSVRSAYFHNQSEFNTVAVKDIGSAEFVAPDYIKNFSDDVVINDIMVTTSLLYAYKVPPKEIMGIIEKITRYYETKGYIDANRASLKDIMNNAVVMLKEKILTDTSSNSLQYQSAEDIAEMIVNMDNSSSPIKTFPEIDVEAGGLKQGNFYGIIGVGGTYKSILAQFIAFINAMNDVLSIYLNGEMSAYQFYERLVSMAIGIDLREQVKLGTLNKETVQSFITLMKEKTKGNIILVNSSGWSKKQILSTIKNVEVTTGKKAKILFMDGLTQMDSLGRDEILATISNSMVCKEIAKEANDGEGIAVVSLVHVSGTISKHKRNTGDNVRGGKKVLANMDAYFCTSLFIDPATNSMVNDEDMAYIKDEFYLRYVDKRSKSPEVNLAIRVAEHIRLMVQPGDPSFKEIKLERR